jgi:hypothetical protein
MDRYEATSFGLFESDPLPISCQTSQWTRPTEFGSCNSIGESMRSESAETNSLGGDVDSEKFYEDLLCDVDSLFGLDDHRLELIESDDLHSADCSIDYDDQRATEEERAHLWKEVDFTTRWLCQQLMELNDLVCDSLHKAKDSSCLTAELRAFQDNIHHVIDDQQVITQLNVAIDIVCDAAFALMCQKHDLDVYYNFHGIMQQISFLVHFFTVNQS